MAYIDSAYDYYVSNYVNKEVSRYDSHKSDDLRRISNRIISANKDSPLYKLANPESAKRYAIDIKERARSLLNVVDSLTDNYGTYDDSFRKKVAVSSDEEKVGVTYIGNGSEDGKAETYRIDVQSLAAPQINTGNYLPDEQCDFLPGSYSFDLNTTTSSYEFQYGVSRGETNLAIIEKLARIINSSDLGITADILNDRAGSSALSLTSVQTGLDPEKDCLFSISSDGSAGSTEAMGILGINQVSQPAHNSSFLVNGVNHDSSSNTFTVNGEFELRLHNVTADSEVTIGFKPNTDAIADNIQTLVDAYNNTLATATEEEAYSPSPRLYLDMSALTRSQKTSLEQIGLVVHDDASVSIDREALAKAVAPERASDTFDTLTAFRDSIGEKAQNISVNPMHYVNKVIVAYKNPGHNFATPYISSIFSGMLIDIYA
jgi:flagellar hook-associated protein 2